jgi:hypothetical protein
MDESIGIENVLASITVAVHVPLIPVHPVPVAPEIVTIGNDEIGNPCPVEVTTAALAFDTAEIATDVAARIPVACAD